MSFFTEDNLITNVSGYTAAGTSSVVGSYVDMEGYDEVTFVALFGTAAANNGIEASESAASGSGYNTLLGGEALSDGTATVVILDVLRPTKRYVEPTVLRGTSTTVIGVWAIRSKAGALPVANNVAGTQILTQLLTPAEGAV